MSKSAASGSETQPAGEFKRKESVFRDWITADGSSGFKAETDRYHLYVARACPWAHRVRILRSMKGLDKVISLSVVDWEMLEKGWAFRPERQGSTVDHLHGKSFLRQVYETADPAYQGRVTVPMLWDKKTGRIVNNESAELIRMFNTEFNEFCETDAQRTLDLYPVELREKIDEVNSWIYPTVNNGVYRCGFATAQEAYDKAVAELFDSLDRLESILSGQRYLTGSRLTEADIRLFTTLFRFDAVYAIHFKCSRKRLVDYPNLWAFTRDIYQIPGVKESCTPLDMDHIRQHYYASHRHINPYGIIAALPDIDFEAPHDRDRFK